MCENLSCCHPPFISLPIAIFLEIHGLFILRLIVLRLYLFNSDQSCMEIINKMTESVWVEKQAEFFSKVALPIF